MLLRWFERWLHQHIFKVGWLLTKNFQTTTILYYTFFLPGVVLHEFSYWLFAGILDIRAERAIQWPEKQEIAELRLTFIKIGKNTSPLKLALITLAPLIAGIIAIWFIANNVIPINEFLTRISTGNLADVTGGIGFLTSTPDFWLWIYLAFTISNTMMPNLKDLRGLRIIFVVIVAISIGFFALGVGNEIVVTVLAGPIADALYALASTLTIIIAVDILVTAILGTIEAVIERITGNSATFENGKLIAMTRQEVAEYKKKQNARAGQPARRAAAIPAETGTPSIYKLALPIPGPPGKEAITQSETVILTPAQKPVPSTPLRDSRAGPDMITSPAVKVEKSVSPLPSPPPAKPVSPFPSLPAANDDEEDEDEEEMFEDEDEEVDEIPDIDFDQTVDDEESDESQEDAEERA